MPVDVPRPVIGVAPGRGRYDRSASSTDRRAQQRERLIDSATHLIAIGERTPTLARVVGLAGIGRNAFYDHFETIEALILHAEHRAVDRILAEIEEASGHARTPHARVRALSRALLAEIVRDHDVGRVAMRELWRDASENGAACRLGEPIGRVMNEARRASVITQPVDDARLAIACTVACSVASTFLRGPRHRVTGIDGTLADVLFRLFR